MLTGSGQFSSPAIPAGIAVCVVIARWESGRLEKISRVQSNRRRAVVEEGSQPLYVPRELPERDGPGALEFGANVEFKFPCYSHFVVASLS